MHIKTLWALVVSGALLLAGCATGPGVKLDTFNKRLLLLSSLAAREPGLTLSTSWMVGETRLRSSGRPRASIVFAMFPSALPSDPTPVCSSASSRGSTSDRRLLI